MTDFEDFAELTVEFVESSDELEAASKEQEEKVVKVAFRIECPHCHWGHAWSNDYINDGWLKLNCVHCTKNFFTKITIPSITIQTQAEEPNAPISSMN